MGTKITDAEMTSTITRHTATAWPVPGEPTLWTVTWLPGRQLTRSQAVTAMTIAEVVVSHAGELADSGSRWWLHIDGWAAELGITGPHAVAEASLSPEDHAVPRGEWPSAGVLPGSGAQPQAGAALAEVRGRTCPLCRAAPGQPCHPKPEGDHLARWLDAYTAGQLTRAYMGMVLGELVVIDVASSVVVSGGAR